MKLLHFYTNTHKMTFCVYFGIFRGFHLDKQATTHLSRTGQV